VLELLRAQVQAAGAALLIATHSPMAASLADRRLRLSADEASDIP
jgi:ABC-type lipoprotein export system ATPase subunit